MVKIKFSLIKSFADMLLTEFGWHCYKENQREQRGYLEKTLFNFISVRLLPFKSMVFLILLLSSGNKDRDLLYFLVN